MKYALNSLNRRLIVLKPRLEVEFPGAAKRQTLFGRIVTGRLALKVGTMTKHSPFPSFAKGIIGPADQVKLVYSPRDVVFVAGPPEGLNKAVFSSALGPFMDVAKIMALRGTRAPWVLHRILLNWEDYCERSFSSEIRIYSSQGEVLQRLQVDCYSGIDICPQDPFIFYTVAVLKISWAIVPFRITLLFCDPWKGPNSVTNVQHIIWDPKDE